jgi:hypothetical protein
MFIHLLLVYTIGIVCFCWGKSHNGEDAWGSEGYFVNFYLICFIEADWLQKSHIG